MNTVTWDVQRFCGLDGIVDVTRDIDAARQVADLDVICMQAITINYPRFGGNAALAQHYALPYPVNPSQVQCAACHECAQVPRSSRHWAPFD